MSNKKALKAMPEKPHEDNQGSYYDDKVLGWFQIYYETIKEALEKGQ